MKRLLFFIAAIAICGCSPKTKQESAIGEYVYLDSYGVLHVKNPCVLGLSITDANGNEYYKSVQRLDLYAIEPIHLMRSCAWCIDDETYEELQEIVMLNE